MIEIISATRQTRDKFFQNTALGKSLLRIGPDSRIIAKIAYENTKGLPEVYNTAIKNADPNSILLFVHDDVWLDDYFIFERISEGLAHFDIIGVAGNKRRVPGQPGWMFLDLKFTKDTAPNISGAVAHGQAPFGNISRFGPTPTECELIDGVFIATRKQILTQYKLEFDPLFNFHFYDLDFCRSARKLGLSIGTWPIAITHQSGGAFGSAPWLAAYKTYVTKWESHSMSMSQTPIHEQHNPDLLNIMPDSLHSVIEIGCSSGALAREYRKMNSECDYFGVEIDPHYTELAKRHCTDTQTLNIEDADSSFFESHRDRQCWVFGDTLEHLKDPWSVLRNIRKIIPETGSIVACIPNAQHWSLQAKLALGDFRYVESGLLDKTHLRWFTRQTILELFSETGYEVVAGWPRVFNEPDREVFLPLIGEMAKLAGCDPKVSIEDAMALQFVIRAVPK